MQSLKAFTCLILAALLVQGCSWVVGIAFPYLSENQRLESEGEDAVAEIVSVTQTGTYLNRQPELELELLIKRSNGDTYGGTTSLICPLISLARYQPGNVVPVKIDVDKKTVTVKGSYAQTPGI